MNESPRSRLARGRAVWAVRRALAPAALELPGELARLAEHNSGLREEVEHLRHRLGQAEDRLAEAERRALESERLLADAEGRIGELRDGLHESRRLNLRVAELTDLVTELVLPLHDREIDPSVLARLRPDTL